MNNKVKRWEILAKLKKKEPKIKDIASLLLKNRGIRTQKEEKEFFNPQNPLKLSLKELGIKEREVKKAIERIKKALKTKEKVIVYGDYDADGICGTAILWEMLYSLHLNVLPYIPERFSEGYGLNIESIKKLKKENPDLGLIITVDHGIVADKKVDVASELGIDVIISDHHEPGKIKPKAYATVHTLKIGGAAVAWVLAREIAKKIKEKSIKPEDSLELVAIGTISDQIALLGPNRSFVKYGLEKLNKTKRLGLTSLFEEASLIPGNIGPYEVGFIIAPRINAMGRLTHAIDSLRLLCTKDPRRARELAIHIGKTNQERQKIVETVVLHARKSLKDGAKEGVIILAHETYHEGVIGLAAAKLVEEFYRPAIVLSKKKEISKASARSISGFNIIETIRKLESFYIEGGGHPMAAGFSIETTKIEEFKRRINKISQPLLTEEILTKKLKVDTEINFNQINWSLFEIVKFFEPTGLGNPTPTFVTKEVKVVEAKVIGKDGKHLRLRLEENDLVFSAIAFGSGHLFNQLSLDKKVDVVYTLSVDEWNGDKRLELKIKDIKFT